MPKGPDDYDSASPVIQKLLDQNARFVAVAGIGLLAPGRHRPTERRRPERGTNRDRLQPRPATSCTSSRAAATHRTRSRTCSADWAPTPRCCSTAAARRRSCCGATPAACGAAPGFPRAAAIPSRCSATRASVRYRAGSPSPDTPMQELTRRTVLRLGAGLAGACALDPIWQLGLATASGAPPADQPSPSSAKASGDIRHRLVRLGSTRRHRNQVGDRPAARPLQQAVASGDRTARSRHDGRRRDGHGRRSGSRRFGEGGLSAVRGGGRRRRQRVVASAASAVRTRERWCSPSCCRCWRGKASTRRG